MVGDVKPSMAEVKENIQPSATTTTTTVTTSGENKSKRYGDANLDGNVTIADATAILQYIGNRDKYMLEPDGVFNADVDGNAGVTPNDALVIQKVDAGLYKLEDLPLKA